MLNPPDFQETFRRLLPLVQQQRRLYLKAEELAAAGDDTRADKTLDKAYVLELRMHLLIDQMPH
jgi:hypothetical protein